MRLHTQTTKLYLRVLNFRGMGEEEKVSVELDLVETKFILTQKYEGEARRKLIYDYKKCVGCGLCVELCPANALELGPVPEIVAGLDAPPVMIEHDKCVFCGACAAFCIFRAFEMFILVSEGGEIKEKNIRSLSEFPSVSVKPEVNERCVPCALCKSVCPRDAIELKIVTRRDILPFWLERGLIVEAADAWGKNELVIDRERCNLCGVCAEFCDAFLMFKKEVTAEEPMPFDDVFFDEEACDFCGLCEHICPEEAISVRSPLKVPGERLKELMEVFGGGIEIDEERCIGCGWCVFVCPYDAISVWKPFSGEVRIVEEKYGECDPQGCRACVNVCPARAWFMPKDPSKGKIAVAEEFCMYCGACEHACRVGVIKVEKAVPKVESWLESVAARKRTGFLHEFLSGLKEEYV